MVCGVGEGTIHEVSYWKTGGARLRRNLYGFCFSADQVPEQAPLQDAYGSDRASVPKRGFVLLVPTRGESNDAPELLFHEPFIPQLGNCHTSRRGIDGLPGQGHELMRVLFIAKD